MLTNMAHDDGDDVDDDDDDKTMYSYDDGEEHKMNNIEGLNVRNL